MKISRTCPVCNGISTIVVDNNEYNNWANGMPAQRAFPSLDFDQRELIISGTCSACWDNIFAETRLE